MNLFNFLCFIGCLFNAFLFTSNAVLALYCTPRENLQPVGDAILTALLLTVAASFALGAAAFWRLL